MHRLQLLSILLLAGFCGHSAYGQLGCTYHQTCTNPVSATDISYQPFINTWTDTYSYTWTITSSGGSISGSVNAPNPGGPSCPNVVFAVSGTISPSYPTDGTEGYTLFSWNASNPVPSGTCGTWTPVPFTYSGTIQNDGNDLGPNTSWSDSVGSGATTVTKSPSDIPASETTIPEGFAVQAQFRQILNAVTGSPDIFQGRQVSEYTGTGLNYDNCYYTGSQIPKLVILGSEWNVGYYPVTPPYITSLNEWVDDYIGWNVVQVRFYRSHYGPNSPVCGARASQVMYISTQGTSGSSAYYSGGLIGEDIYTDHVTAYRDGVSQTIYE